MRGELGERLKDAVTCSDKLFRYVYDLEAAVAKTNNRDIPSFEEVEHRIKNNTYLQSFAQQQQSGGGTPSRMVILWILLPIAIAVTAMITYAIMRSRK